MNRAKAILTLRGAALELGAVAAALGREGKPAVERAAGAVSRVLGAVVKGGDALASEAVWLARTGTCDRCPAARGRGGRSGGPDAGGPDARGPEPAQRAVWCGPPLEDHSTEAEPEKRTCGCLVEVKALVAAEACPRGKWAAATAEPAPTASAAPAARTRSA